MHPDESQIRDLVSTWLSATKSGDTAKVLSLMTDDAIFLIPGQPVMRKPDFAAAAKAQSAQGAPRIDGTSEIQEIQVMGDWAFMWTRLKVVVTPQDGSPAATRAGHTLTILRKQQGQWLLARDANLLAPVPAR
ncbi:YybH family protein [Variovorax sp. PBL-E5]|uniref:YybH family protein n=1 Tax=Variovorax sp. PBL-E5 TaxID=434014 RepID=UPI001317435C|nr:SgcJ/EcaC family oxidoreductase [Variovorax sp. PBL-E5]VTU16295.1 SnoaL-like domain protein [Variovorax sp. PBL-E5]